MKKFVSLLLTLIILCTLCACGSKDPTIIGKYNSEEINGAYYQFDKNGICYIGDELSGWSMQYTYEVSDTPDFAESEISTYTVHIYDTASNSSLSLIWDPTNEQVWDPDFGLFHKE